MINLAFEQRKVLDKYGERIFRLMKFSSLVSDDWETTEAPTRLSNCMVNKNLGNKSTGQDFIGRPRNLGEHDKFKKNWPELKADLVFIKFFFGFFQKDISPPAFSENGDYLPFRFSFFCGLPSSFLILSNLIEFRSEFL